jgi:hypothetical protein
VKVVALIVDEAIVSLKVAVMTLFRITPTAPLAGVVDTTAG